MAAFVSKFDSLGLVGMSLPPSKLKPPMPMQGGAAVAFAERQQNRNYGVPGALGVIEDCSPVRMTLATQPSLLEQTPEEEWVTMDDVSFEMEVAGVGEKARTVSGVKRMGSVLKEVLSGKENLPV